MRLLGKRRRRKDLTYMMFSEHGNAIGSWEKEKEAIAALNQILEVEPEAADAVAIIAFDYYGHVDHRVYPRKD